MYQDIALAVKKKGIIKIDNFINHQELNELKKIVLMYKAPKNDPKSYFPTSFCSLSKIILKLNLIKLKQTLVIWNLKNKKKFNDISDSFFSKKVNYILQMHIIARLAKVLFYHGIQTKLIMVN